MAELRLVAHPLTSRDKLDEIGFAGESIKGPFVKVVKAVAVMNVFSPKKACCS
jgi:hypothetical protein